MSGAQYRNNNPKSPQFYKYCVSGIHLFIMEYIHDLSFSNLVDLIQGEEIKAADVLHTIAIEMEENNRIIEGLESQLSQAKGRRDTLISGTQRVMQHIKKEYPLAVKRQTYIVVITKDNISIERNVI